MKRKTYPKSAALDDIRKPRPEDGEPFTDKMARLAAEWRERQAEAGALDAAIAENLERLGFGAPIND